MPNQHFDNILYDTVGLFASALQGRSHPHSLPGCATMAQLEGLRTRLQTFILASLFGQTAAMFDGQ